MDNGPEFISIALADWAEQSARRHSCADGNGAGLIDNYVADLSRLAEVRQLAETISQAHDQLDVIINNAGVLRAPDTVTRDGLDVRFAVNTVAPYMLTQSLLPVLVPAARVVNLSSAAQSPVELDALRGKIREPQCRDIGQWSPWIANHFYLKSIFLFGVTSRLLH